MPVASQAQPGGLRQVFAREMQESPQALPLLQVLQHAAKTADGGSGRNICHDRGGMDFSSAAPAGPAARTPNAISAAQIIRIAGLMVFASKLQLFREFV